MTFLLGTKIFIPVNIIYTKN